MARALRGRAERLKAGGGADGILREIDDVAESVRTGRPPRVGLAESRGNVAETVALLHPAREGRVVRV